MSHYGDVIGDVAAICLKMDNRSLQDNCSTAILQGKLTYGSLVKYDVTSLVSFN